MSFNDEFFLSSFEFLCGVVLVNEHSDETLVCCGICEIDDSLQFYMHTPHCTRTHSYSRQHAAHITIWKHGVKNKTINTYYYTHFYFWTIRFTVPWFLWLFLSVFSISYFLVCLLDTEDSKEIVQYNRIGLLSVVRATFAFSVYSNLTNK